MDGRLKAKQKTVASGPAGFTLFELLVVLVIVGLVTAVVAPRWVAALPGIQLTTAARKTAAMLRHAGNQAVAEQKIYRGVILLEEHKVSVYRIETDVWWAATVNSGEEDSPLSTFELPEGVRFDSAHNGLGGAAEPDRLNIFFYPGGGNSGGQVAMANERNRRLIIQTDFITGSVRVSEPSN